jgi:hypothetical protein
MYLDTTFATKSEPYSQFPSKAEGVRELLESVERYPKETIFYFHSWTFGYEDVWIALSAFLQSQIHLDSYRAQIYGSLSPLENKSLREKMVSRCYSPSIQMTSSSVDQRGASPKVPTYAMYRVFMC